MLEQSVDGNVSYTLQFHDAFLFIITLYAGLLRRIDFFARTNFFIISLLEFERN
jgi:hypothetical protein